MIIIKIFTQFWSFITHILDGYQSKRFIDFEQEEEE